MYLSKRVVSDSSRELNLAVGQADCGSFSLAKFHGKFLKKFNMYNCLL